MRLYRYRYWIALGIFILCLLFKVSGSSIGAWSSILGSRDTGAIGSFRDIRSDEWGMLTAMCLAQEHNPAGAYERYAPAGNVMMDRGIVYALPSKDLLTVFRPFYWGYLLFGSEVGLSWYWCGRFLALFLSVFELGMLIAKKDKAVSLFLAVCVCFAPFLQWWYAVNGLVEMLICGSVFLLGLRCLLTEMRLWKRAAAAFLMAVSVMGYVLVFYPAWMAPIAYGFLPVFLWMILKYRNSVRIQGKRAAMMTVAERVLPWLLCAIIVLGGLLYLAVSSKATIQAVLESSYPGRAVVSSGGGVGYWLLKYPFSLAGIRQDDPSLIENSSVICFAPAGAMMSAWILLKERKADRLLLFLLGTEAFLTWFYCVGTEVWIARCLLLTFTNAHRGAQVIGFLRLFILARALTCKTEAVKRGWAGLGALAGSGFVVWMSWCYTQYDASVCRFSYWDDSRKLFAVFAALAVLFYLFLRYEKRRKWRRYLPLLAAGGVVFFAGIQINPVRFGTDVITESAIYQELRTITAQEPEAVWVEIGIDYPASNLVAMAGGNCLTTSQTYPEMERWEIFGMDEEDKDVYNRYCHIRAVLGEEIECTLLQTDYVQMTLNDEVFSAFSVDYVLTGDMDLSALKKEWNVRFELLFQCGKYRVYRCLYKTELEEGQRN